MGRHKKNKSAEAPQVSPNTGSLTRVSHDSSGASGSSVPGVFLSPHTASDIEPDNGPAGSTTVAVLGVLSKPELAAATGAFEPLGAEPTSASGRNPLAKGADVPPPANIAGARNIPGGIAGDPVETPTLFRVKAAPAEDIPSGDPLDGLDVMGLIALRAQIDARLPPLSISDTNLEEELVLQYHAAKALVAAAARDVGVPTNQKAQVQNSCAAILKTLADVKTAVYNSERVQAIQQALEKAFQGETEEVKKRFFERYARLVRESTAQKDSKIQQFAPV